MRRTWAVPGLKPKSGCDTPDRPSGLRHGRRNSWCLAACPSRLDVRVSSEAVFLKFLISNIDHPDILSNQLDVGPSGNTLTRESLMSGRREWGDWSNANLIPAEIHRCGWNVFN